MQQQELISAIPDLRDLSLTRLTGLGGSVPARSLTLYLESLEDSGVPLKPFNSGI
jgi:hypothetical protein